MLHILEWLVYFAKCTKWHIKNESKKDWMDRQHLQGTLQEKKKREQKQKNSQVNGYQHREPLGEIFMRFCSICSNPIHRTRMIFHTPQQVPMLSATQIRESFRTENGLERSDSVHYLDPLIPVF